jgi:hypothetical protein
MYRYDVDENTRLVVATFEGEVSDADLFDYLAHMLSHTRYGTGWRSLIDLTPAQQLKLTGAGVQRMRALPMFMEERLHGARAAIVVPESSPAHAMASKYKAMGQAAKYQIAVFGTRAEAMQWLESA